MVDDSVERCEHQMRRIITVFKSDDGVVQSARVKLVRGKFNRLVVNLAPVFYDTLSEIQDRAGDVSIHQQESSDSNKTSFETEKT